MMTAVLRSLVLFSAAVGCCHSLCADDQSDLNKRHRVTLRLVAEILPRNDLSGHAVDDELSRRIFDLMIDRLDPDRVYFTQEDLRSLTKSREDLDDQAARGDLSFPRELHRQYLARVMQATQWGKEHLGKPQEFLSDETYVLKPTEFCADEASLKQRWRKRIKFQLLGLRADGWANEEAVKLLTKRYVRISTKNRYRDQESFFEQYLAVFTKSFAPHNDYFGPKTLDSFNS